MCPNSYRPITLSSIISKLLERICKHRIEYILNENNSYDSSQEGFISSRSTTRYLYRLVNEIKSINNNQFGILILCDFSHAFDNVWIEGLILKLFNIGIKGKITSSNQRLFI